MNYNEPIKVPLKYIVKGYEKSYLDDEVCSFLGRKGELMEIGFFTEFGRETVLGDYKNYIMNPKFVQPEKLFFMAKNNFLEYYTMPDTMTSYSWLVMPLLRHCIRNEYRYNHINNIYREIIEPVHPTVLSFLSGYTFAHRIYEKIKKIIIEEATTPLVSAILDIKNWHREDTLFHTCLNTCTVIHLIWKLIPEDEEDPFYYFRQLITHRYNFNKIKKEYGETNKERFERGLLCDIDKREIDLHSSMSTSDKIQSFLSSPKEEIHMYKLKTKVNLLKSLNIPIYFKKSLICSMRNWYKLVYKDLSNIQSKIENPWTESRWNASNSLYWQVEQTFNFDSGKHDIDPSKCIRFIIKNYRNVFMREKDSVLKNLNDVVNFTSNEIFEDDLDQRYIGVFVKVNKDGIYDPHKLYYHLFLGTPIITLIDEVSRVSLVNMKKNTSTVIAKMVSIDKFVELRDIKTKKEIKPIEAIQYSLNYAETTFEHVSGK